jgi:hypothetical protein
MITELELPRHGRRMLRRHVESQHTVNEFLKGNIPDAAPLKNNNFSSAIETLS